MMKYKGALKHPEEGVAVWVPGLPGCWSQGQSEGKALVNIEDAIRQYVAAIEDSGSELQGSS